MMLDMKVPKILYQAGAVTGAAAILSLAGLGIASAAIPDSSGVIHACYKTPVPGHGTNLEVIDSENGGTCANGYSPVTWNQTGPQGATGATGATGPAGPAGPSTGGSSGLDLEIVRVDTTPPGNVLPDGISIATATCPADHPFLFGGGGLTASTPIMGSLPTTSTGAEINSESETGNVPGSWTVAVAKGQNDNVSAYAICGK